MSERLSVEFWGSDCCDVCNNLAYASIDRCPECDAKNVRVWWQDVYPDPGDSLECDKCRARFTWVEWDEDENGRAWITRGWNGKKEKGE